MNCEKGDLAVIVGCNGFGVAGQLSKLLVGRIVKVTHLDSPSNGLACYADQVWKFEEPIPLNWEGRRFIADGIHDDMLRPLRDNPGTDETLLWSPVPSKLKEKA